MAGRSRQGHDHPVPAPPPSRRHCWVAAAAETPGPYPGLVLGWEKRDERWFALVVYLIEAEGVIVQQWLPSETLTRVG